MIGRLLGGAIFAASMLVAAGASAADWYYWEDDSYVPIASVESPTTALDFACDYGDLYFDYYVDRDALASALSGRKTAFFSISFDNGDNLRWIEADLFFGTDQVSIGVQAGDADELAHLAARALRSITVALSMEKPGSATRYFNQTVFSASGSSAAIRKVYSECGEKY